MAGLRVEDVIRRPIITEKNTWLMEKSQYSFEVAITANKIQIKEAVEVTFGVKVLAVNTMVAKGKTKRWRGQEYRRSDVKKAVVTVADGDRIDVTTSI